MLHLSTRWGFTSIRKLALSSIEPPTPHDRLLLARTYSVDNWVIPALSALCERSTPLTLPEAREMSIEDVVLVSTVREDIRGRTLQVNAAEISLRVEAEQLGALGLEIPNYLRFPKSEASSPLCLQRGKKDDDAHEIHEDAGKNSGVSGAARYGELTYSGIDDSLQTVEEVLGIPTCLKGNQHRPWRTTREK